MCVDVLSSTALALVLYRRIDVRRKVARKGLPAPLEALKELADKRPVESHDRGGPRQNTTVNPPIDLTPMVLTSFCKAAINDSGTFSRGRAGSCRVVPR